ncbi:MAG: S1/P1 nuclease, partial [Sphingomicrobium sp.]
QPLHVGKCCDKGGNDVKVKWFGRDLNLHSVWDSAMVDDEQLSFTEFAAKLDRHTTRENIIDWWDINPRDWISESAQYREQIYANIPRPKKAERRPRKGEKPLPDLSYGYVYEFTPVMERRLQQAGVRLAAYLNDIYSEPQPVGGTARR